MTPVKRRAQPGGELEIPSEVDFSLPFAAAEQEYRELVAGDLALQSVLDDETWDGRMPLEDTGVEFVEQANRELYPSAEDLERAEWFEWRMRMDS